MSEPTYAETRSLLAADFSRLAALSIRTPLVEPPPPRRLRTSSSWVAVWLYRHSHYFFRRRRYLLARLCWQTNQWLTGADISMIASIGPGLWIEEPFATIFLGKAGRNLTLRAHTCCGGGMNPEDVGAGSGLPVLGDDVVIDVGAVVLGPIVIGDRAHIGPMALATRDLAADSRLHAPQGRVTT